MLTYVGTSLHLLPPISKPVVHFERSDSFELWQLASWNNIYRRNSSISTLAFIHSASTFAAMASSSTDTDGNHLPGFWMTALQALAISSLLASSGYWFSIKKLWEQMKWIGTRLWSIMIIVQPIGNSIWLIKWVYLHNIYYIKTQSGKNDYEWGNVLIFMGPLVPQLTIKLK